MNRFFRSNQFASAPSTRVSNPGVRSGQSERTPVITSGTNAPALASVRCESGHVALTAACPPNVVPQSVTPGVVMDERVALLTDEGQNSSNAWALHDHVEGKRYSGTTIESLVNAVSRAEQNASDAKKKDGQ